MKAIIHMKSGKVSYVNDLKFIASPKDGGITKDEKFEEFFVYHSLYTFVGVSATTTVDGQFIEYVEFSK